MQNGDKVGRKGGLVSVYRKGVSFYILITETDVQSFLKEREERFGRNALYLGVHYITTKCLICLSRYLRWWHIYNNETWGKANIKN